MCGELESSLLARVCHLRGVRKILLVSRPRSFLWLQDSSYSSARLPAVPVELLDLLRRYRPNNDGHLCYPSVFERLDRVERHGLVCDGHELFRPRLR